MTRERIFIGVAWPYANGPLHLGHIAGCYLPADIFARYHRLKGNDVLMVSGSDMHGTPIMLRAEKEKKTPAAVAEFYHQQFLECWKKLGISFDLFTKTETENHVTVTHQIFKTLHNNGYIYKDSMVQLFCPVCQRFLADRYVEGICPFCGFEEARGDQCDNCGKPLNSIELVSPRCKNCGTSPQKKNSEHFFFRLTAFQDKLLEWVRQQPHWKDNVHNFTLRYIESGLKDRPITRDLSWGISLPLPGYEDKRIYVWFEAVIGYLSASMEWASSQGDKESWRNFWTGEAKSYYFIGKDNIPFHTIIWPAMLMGYNGLNLPYDVPANEFLNLEGRQFSTSRNWAVWLPDYLERYAADSLRYYLSANMPESADSDFSWQDFFRRNNDEMVATWGNLAQRVLSFTCRSFDNTIPEPGTLDQASLSILNKSEETFKAVDEGLHSCRFRESLRRIMLLAQETNRYLEDKSPWKEPDQQEKATALYTALCSISAIKTMFYPFLPFSSSKLHFLLGEKEDMEKNGWKINRPKPGTPLPSPQHLFIKLDEKLAQEELNKLKVD